MQPVGSFRIPPDHACLPGHFPGQPLVPGVLLLDHALRVIEASLPGARFTGLLVVKCTSTVGPASEVEIRCAAPKTGRVAFECWCEGRIAMHGIALL